MSKKRGYTMVLRGKDAVDLMNALGTKTAKGGWLPIETAPNDATILVYRSTGEYQLVQAEDNDYTWQAYVNEGLDRPTHWMPPPTPPEPDAK